MGKLSTRRRGCRGAVWRLVVGLGIFGVAAACSTPMASRLVSVTIERPSEVGLEAAAFIGIMPFKAPDSRVGDQLTQMVAAALTRSGQRVEVIGAKPVFPLVPARAQRLGRQHGYQALLAGRISDYVARAATEPRLVHVFSPLLSPPGPPEWKGIRENPGIAGTFYYRLHPAAAPEPRQVMTTSLECSLVVDLQLVDAASGQRRWQQRLHRSRRLRLLTATGHDLEGVRLAVMQSIAAEVGGRLNPQRVTVKRMLRAPLLSWDASVVQLVRQGINSAALGQWHQAEAYFNQARARAPEQASIIGNLGVVYEETGRLAEALQAYNQAACLRPRDPTYRFYAFDLASIFAPKYSKDDLPALILGRRADNVVLLDGGKQEGHRPGEIFRVFRVEVAAAADNGRRWDSAEIEIARGIVTEVRERLSLGQITMAAADFQVRRGDVFRLDAAAKTLHPECP